MCLQFGHNRYSSYILRLKVKNNIFIPLIICIVLGWYVYRVFQILMVIEPKIIQNPAENIIKK